MEVTEITGMTVGMSNEREKQLFPPIATERMKKLVWKCRRKLFKTFKNNSALTLAVYQNYTHTDDLNTMQGEVSDHFLKQSNTRLSVLYNYKIKKRFNLQLKVAEEVSYTKTNGNSVTTTAFVPFLKLSYDYKKHSLQLTGTVRSGEPSLSDRTGYEYRMNEYELFVGNPELKNYLRYNGTLRYNWNVSKRWTFIIYSSFEALSNQDYSLHRYDSDRNTFVSNLLMEEVACGRTVRSF